MFKKFFKEKKDKQKKEANGLSRFGISQEMEKKIVEAKVANLSDAPKDQNKTKD